MIVLCPNCQLRLRFNMSTQVSRMLVRCPSCQTRFRVQAKKNVLKAFIAHEDEEVCRQLRERVALSGVSTTICRDCEEITAQFQTEGRCVLLLDVAFNGTFPFQLIDKIKANDHRWKKVVLLSSVYNRTAYKKRPDSLYGADAYLELHHIGDRLIPTLAELFPDIAPIFAAAASTDRPGDERSLPPVDLFQQADSLAKLLVADIILYHQDRLEQGIASGQLKQLFSEQLAEGRRMLVSRLPAAAGLPVDFIRQAFDVACQSYPRS